MHPLVRRIFQMQAKISLAKVSSHALKSVLRQRKQSMKLRRWGISFFGPPLHMGAPTWHVEGHGTTYDVGPAKDIGKPEPVLFNQGEGLSPTHEPNLNQPVNKGMSLNLLPINSAPARVAGRLKFFRTIGILLRTTIGCWRLLWVAK